MQNSFKNYAPYNTKTIILLPRNFRKLHRNLPIFIALQNGIQFDVKINYIQLSKVCVVLIQNSFSVV